MNLKVRAIVIVIAIVIGMITARNKSSRRQDQTQRQRWEREHNLSNPGDDPRFKAAEAEARRRWPEFVTALSRREPNVAYAVKAKFTDGDTTEWMWMQVESVSGDTITGVLDNVPVDVHNVKQGDRVTKKLADIDDWIVGRNGSAAQGGFTSKVLRQIEDEKTK
jgi:uncharacterized protein YegJ (DUF2314 family)